MGLSDLINKAKEALGGSGGLADKAKHAVEEAKEATTREGGLVDKAKDAAERAKDATVGDGGLIDKAKNAVEGGRGDAPEAGKDATPAEPPPV